VIVEVAADNPLQPPPLLEDWLVHAPSHLLLDLNRDSEIGGTLVAVLNILRPHLPTVVPARNRFPSHPTLVRALREARHRESWGVVQALSKSYH
jgi:hypothetical protein